MQRGWWSRTIRAAFDLLFMMCHLIASISPYRTLLVPLYQSTRCEGSQEESRRERWKKPKNWRLSWWGGAGSQKIPWIPLIEPMTERRGPERETDTARETGYQVAVATCKTLGEVIYQKSCSVPELHKEIHISPTGDSLGCLWPGFETSSFEISAK